MSAAGQVRLFFFFNVVCKGKNKCNRSPHNLVGASEQTILTKSLADISYVGAVCEDLKLALSNQHALLHTKRALMYMSSTLW